MSKYLNYWKLNFDSQKFPGIMDFHDGSCFETRKAACEAVEKLRKHLETNYLSRNGRRILHEKQINRTTNDFSDKYWYRIVVLDETDYSEIVSFGCERKTLPLR